MTKEEKKFIMESNNEKLRNFFLNSPEKLFIFLKEIINEDNETDNEVAYVIEALTLVIFLEEKFLENSNFQKLLCEVSKRNNHYQHENIALTFERLHSPKLINCTYDLAIMELDYMEYDEFFNIARKCTYALGYTNTPKAKEKLELLANNKNELIREYALKQLNRHDFTDKDVEEQY